MMKPCNFGFGRDCQMQKHVASGCPVCACPYSKTARIIIFLQFSAPPASTYPHDSCSHFFLFHFRFYKFVIKQVLQKSALKIVDGLHWSSLPLTNLCFYPALLRFLAKQHYRTILLTSVYCKAVTLINVFRESSARLRRAAGTHRNWAAENADSTRKVPQRGTYASGAQMVQTGEWFEKLRKTLYRWQLLDRHLRNR